MKNLAILPLPLLALIIGGCAVPRSSGRDRGTPAAGTPDAGTVTPTSCTTTSLDTDAHHCGSCANDCGKLDGVDPSKVSCVAGECKIDGACAAGRAHCSPDVSDGCETDITTTQHCGACDQDCTAPNTACTAKAGVYSCAASCGGATPTMCGTACVDTNSDVNNCGGCGMACPTVTNGSPTCSVGACGLQCDSGYTLMTDTCAADMPTMMPPMGMPGVWTAQTSGTAQTLWSVWGASSTSVLVVGSGGALLESDGSGTWTAQPVTTQSLFSAWGFDADHVLLAGDTTSGRAALFRSTMGGPLENLGTTSFNLSWVWGSGLGDYYVLGASGNIIHSTDASTFYAQTSGTTVNLWGMWGSADDDLYVVGASGRILQGDGAGNWSKTTSGTTNELMAVWGSGASDIYVVGRKGTILHSTGTSFSKQTSGITDDLFSVWGSAAGDVYVVGDNGTVLHSAGDGTWTAQMSGTTDALWGSWGSGPGDVYAVGDNGTILHKM